jgi:allantoinase
MFARTHRYDYSIIDRRPDYVWPGNKRLAFYIGTNIEVFAFGQGLGHDPTKHGEPQTQRNYAWRDYGNRVGVWRYFDLLDEFQLKTSCLINSWLYDFHPEIFQRMRERGHEVVGHGRTNAERQKGLWEIDEQRLIQDVTDAIEKHEGRKPKGWLGAGAAENAATPDLLKEAGYTYLLDWPCDDQPVWLRTRSGPILSIPYPLELNDAGQVIWRQHNTREFCDMLVDQFDEMIKQCVHQPLVCSISLHPYIVGHPFRIAAVRKVLNHIVNHPHRDRVWFTRAEDISDYCYAMKPGIIPGS